MVGLNIRSLARNLRAFLPLIAGFAACAGTGDRAREQEATPYQPELLQPEEESIGAFLARVDVSIRAWNHLALTAASDGDRRKAHILEDDLAYRTRLRKNELVEQLEAGPPHNRIVAAVALGFTGSDDALSPLLAALSDPEPEVRSNALLGLALLAKEDTPIGGVVELLQEGIQPKTRSNAAYALRQIIAAGGAVDNRDDIRQAARSAIGDPDAVVRAQCALLSAQLLDDEAIDRLTYLLRDEVPLAALAGVRALTYIGSRNAQRKGTCARALAGSLDEATPTVREGMLRALQKLADANYGHDSERWIEWAHRLP